MNGKVFETSVQVRKQQLMFLIKAFLSDSLRVLRDTQGFQRGETARYASKSLLGIPWEPFFSPFLEPLGNPRVPNSSGACISEAELGQAAKLFGVCPPTLERAMRSQKGKPDRGAQRSQEVGNSTVTVTDDIPYILGTHRTRWESIGIPESPLKCL